MFFNSLFNPLWPKKSKWYLHVVCVCVIRFKDLVGSFNIFYFLLSCRAPLRGIIDMREMFRHFKTKYFFCHRCTGTCHWMAPEVFVSDSYDEKAPETAQSLHRVQFVLLDFSFDSALSCSGGLIFLCYDPFWVWLPSLPQVHVHFCCTAHAIVAVSASPFDFLLSFSATPGWFAKKYLLRLAMNWISNFSINTAADIAIFPDDCSNPGPKSCRYWTSSGERLPPEP